MLLTRKIGSILRGKATPLQVLLATTFGGMLGFIPGFFLADDLGGGFLQAPGLILVLLCFVLVLNANLAVFGLTTLVAKLLSFVCLPVSYAVGTFLIDTMTGLFRWLVNAKGTAWFGLDHYATAGGLVLGLCFGVLLGLLLNRSIRAIRTHMANVEENSASYQKYAQKGWVKFSTWLLLGKGKGKQSWKELAESEKRGLPVRITGVLLAGVAVASVWVFAMWFSTPILTRNLKAGLEAVNGATVDVEAATLGFGGGVLRVKNLAMADSKALDKNLLAAGEMVATVDIGELLKRRLVIDELRSTDASAGTKRGVPGLLIVGEPEPPEPPAPAGTKTIEDWLQEYEVWKQRFEQAREWIEVIVGDDEAVPPTEPSPEEIEQERKEQERLGLAMVVARHLREPGPRVLIRKIAIEGITWTRDGTTEKIDLRGENISTAPKLVVGTPLLGLAAQSGAYKFDLTGRSSERRAAGFAFAFTQLPVDSVFGKLKISGAAPVRGGTMDLAANGTFSKPKGQAMTMELPLQVAMKGTTFAIPGTKETLVENLTLPVGLRGSVTNPSVSLDDKALQDALLAAGKQELANFVQGQAGKLLGRLPTDLQGIIDPTKSPAQMLEDAQKKAEAETKRLADEAKKKAEDEVKKKLEAEAKKLLPGGLKGILPGGRGGGV